MSSKLRSFIPLAVVITLLSGMVYGAGQQILRQSANDPQIQFSQDIAASLNSGNAPDAVIPPSKVDMEKSLALFIMIFDNKGNLVLSTGEISGKPPVLPPGIFDNVTRDGAERLTWQPQPDVRDATVVTKYEKGFVLVGRSLKEVEIREHNLMVMVGLGWFVTMIATLASVFIFTPTVKKSRG